MVILASRGSQNCNSQDSSRGEKNTKKSVLPKIIFFVAWSRSRWNFNNYFLDFPGEPLGRAMFTNWEKKKKRKRRKETVLYRFLHPGSRCAALPFWYPRWKKNCDWIFVVVATWQRRVYFDKRFTLSRCFKTLLRIAWPKASCSLKNVTARSNLRVFVHFWKILRCKSLS